MPTMWRRNLRLARRSSAPEAALALGRARSGRRAVIAAPGLMRLPTSASRPCCHALKLQRCTVAVHQLLSGGALVQGQEFRAHEDADQRLEALLHKDKLCRRQVDCSTRP